MDEEPVQRIWFWKFRNQYFRLIHNATFQKYTAEGWVPADTYYLWRAIQDPEFIEVDEGPAGD